MNPPNKSNQLTETKLKEIFMKYDINRDNSLDTNELKSLVTDVLKESHKIKELNEEHEEIISKTVQEIVDSRDNNKNKKLEWNEFSEFYKGKNIIEQSEGKEIFIIASLLESSRGLVYTSRIAAVMKNLPTIMAGSRPLAYASEVGESFRKVTSPTFVRFMYGLSWAYVFLDTGVKTYGMKKHGREAMTYCCLDTSIFHTFASMALPAFTIHTIVKYSGKFFMKTLGSESKFSKILPVMCGLGSIPFIIHPLDHFTEFVMDKSIRKIYGHKIPGLYDHHKSNNH